ncbi:MAG TPA: YceI family protein [Vicinamibacterales bacterium]|nr:YceI family protein [Vicinamibacterales bacterium]
MSTATTTTTRTYQIDLAHSEATFQVRHLITKVRGSFTDFAGTIDLDAEHPERSSVSVTIQAASVLTRQPDRDTHLRSADFFDVERFPTLTFVSTSIKARGNDLYDVTGTLTIHGVSKTITLPVTHLGTAKDPWGVEKAAFETDITINRKDFGLNWNAALETGGFLVGDDVQIHIEVQAAAK